MIGDSIMVDLVRITVGGHSVRDEEDERSLDGLCDSIRRVGLMQPLLVGFAGEGYDLISGHRRWAACVRAGLTKVPCRVHEGSAADVKECVFAENFHRADISPIEQAAAIKDVLEQGTMTEEQVAVTFRRSVEWVKRQVALLSWPADVLEMMHRGQIKVTAASWLAQISDDVYRKFLIDLAVDGGATARSTENWYRGWVASIPMDELEDASVPPDPKYVGPPVAESPCLVCSDLFRPDGMVSVLMCTGCLQSMRESVRKVG